MKIIPSDSTGGAWTMRYEPGDPVVLVRDCYFAGMHIAAGESGTVVRLISTDDRRLAHQLYIEVEFEDDTITVLPTDVIP